jgi:NAD(P)-dependent dehydrogenase (short-subunit alcohol dehydrogenase family)
VTKDSWRSRRPRCARIDFDDVMLTREYDGRQAYGQSKLALVMFTFDLAAALQGTGVTANAIHPATSHTRQRLRELALELTGQSADITR